MLASGKSAILGEANKEEVCEGTQWCQKIAEMEGAFNKVNAADMLERKIGFSLPSDYKNFLRQHPDGAIYYPKVIQKGEAFFSFCDMTKDAGDDERWLWEPDDGIIGQVEIKLFKVSEIYTACRKSLPRGRLFHVKMIN